MTKHDSLLPPRPARGTESTQLLDLMFSADRGVTSEVFGQFFEDILALSRKNRSLPSTSAESSRSRLCIFKGLERGFKRFHQFRVTMFRATQFGRS